MKDTDLFRKGKFFAKAIRDKKIEIIQKTVINQRQMVIMQRIEGELLKEINSELDDKDKKIYSNEGSRQAELRYRSEINTDHKASKQIVDTNNIAIGELHIGLDFSQNMLRLVIAFLT